MDVQTKSSVLGVTSSLASWRKKKISISLG